MDYIDPYGYGNCLKRDIRFSGSPYSCYVKEPSRCPDKEYVQYPDVGKILSAMACLESMLIDFVINQHLKTMRRYELS